MLRNNVELDLKTRFIEDGITQTEMNGSFRYLKGFAEKRKSGFAPTV
jgi:hypothetical protein